MLETTNVAVWFAYSVHLWEQSRHEEALGRMRHLLERYGHARAPSSENRTEAELALASKAWLRLGQWQRQLESGGLEGRIRKMSDAQAVERGG